MEDIRSRSKRAGPFAQLPRRHEPCTRARWRRVHVGENSQRDAIPYLDGLRLLRLGGGLTPEPIGALNAGKARAQQNLTDAASLSFGANTLKLVDLTGHKRISGYPEGRRMWLRVAWLDELGAAIATDGAYGAFEADVGGKPAVLLPWPTTAEQPA